MAHVVIDAEICKACELCVSACKFDALAMSDTPNSKGYTPAVLARPENCNGCTMCAVMCPDLVITVFK